MMEAQSPVKQRKQAIAIGNNLTLRSLSSDFMRNKANSNLKRSVQL